MDVLVRPAGAQDGPAAAQTLVASRREGERIGSIPRGVHDDGEIVRWFCAELLPSREVWLAEQDGSCVGVLVLDDEWLDHLYVRPDRSGQGIGSLLLSLAMAIRPNGLSLWCFQSNHAARRFYQRRGMVEVELTDGAGNEERAPDVRFRWPGSAL